MKPVKLEMRVTRQNDGWGCGYCAAASVYRHYGLDPRRLGLRDRLGTDNHVLPYGAPFRDRLQALTDMLGLDLSGTLCPDMFAALAYDGFGIATAFNDYSKPLRRHLRRGHPALALVDSLAHWVAVAGIDDEGVLILDGSGYGDPSGRSRLRYRMRHCEFDDFCDGVALVRRGKRLPAANCYGAYLSPGTSKPATRGQFKTSHFSCVIDTMIPGQLSTSVLPVARSLSL